MTLQPLPCEFPYIWGKFNFLYYLQSTEWWRPLSGVHSIMGVKLAWLVRVGGARPSHPPSLLLPSPVKLQCTLQLSGQIHWPYFISTNICTLWFSPYLPFPKKFQSYTIRILWLSPIGAGAGWAGAVAEAVAGAPLHSTWRWRTTFASASIRSENIKMVLFEMRTSVPMEKNGEILQREKVTC
jgi:hypothetical protein